LTHAKPEHGLKLDTRPMLKHEVAPQPESEAELEFELELELDSIPSLSELDSSLPIKASH